MHALVFPYCLLYEHFIQLYIILHLSLDVNILAQTHSGLQNQWAALKIILVKYVCEPGLIVCDDCTVL